MAKLVRHDETALSAIPKSQVPSPRKEGKQMRPPADWQRVERKVGVESERASLRPADSAVMSASAKAPLKALFV